MTITGLLLLMMLAAMPLASGCGDDDSNGGAPQPPTMGFGPGESIPPAIAAPARENRKPLETDADRLPAGASAHLPAFDGDSFFVTLPVTQRDTVTAGEVEQAIVKPILEAIGFSGGVEALSRPPAMGVELPRGDLDALARVVAYEYENTPELQRPRTDDMINAFLTGESSPAIDAALSVGEGMTFSQFVAGINRLEIQYPFVQVVGDVPIEHSLLLASRWEGQGVTTVRGALIDSHRIVNSIKLSPALLARVEAARMLAQVDGIDAVLSESPIDGPHLVLLPYGSEGDGRTRLRYAFRTMMNAAAAGLQGPFIVWYDAEDGEVLQLLPLVADVTADGSIYNRDPAVGTTVGAFDVDAAAAGFYQLRLGGVINRVDYRGDGFDALDVSISDMSGTSSSMFANFNQTPLNNATQALCSSGTNKAFQQLNFFSVIHRYYQQALALGVFTPFPTAPWNPVVEGRGCTGGNPSQNGQQCRLDTECCDGMGVCGTCTGIYCNANASMFYGACQGYFDAACPDVAGGFLNFAHDNTIIGHELAHNLTWRMTAGRPPNWCCAPSPTCMPACSIPIGMFTIHDLADHWAGHFDSTNCVAGWAAKNLGGIDAGLNCAAHNEGGGLPRLAKVTIPFDPNAPGDHFPEHRRNGLVSGGYADMHIPSAALWEVRLGMRSKCRPSGLPQYAVRFARALRETGFLGGTLPNTCLTGPSIGMSCSAFADCSGICGISDTQLYRQLYDLEKELVDQWATSGSPMGAPAFAHNGPHTTNKVTAGFAATGLFLLPPQCLDGDAATTEPSTCPAGENGADAVVDIDDNDAADDLIITGVTHRETDFLEIAGSAPTFRVWTGPRYTLSGTGGAGNFSNPAPCNPEFRVEASTDPGFAAIDTVTSPWMSVDTDPTTAATPECYGTWTPTAAEWTLLQASGSGTRIYYRAATRRSAGVDERSSTAPGNGLWMVPPPYAVITASGQSDY